MTRSSVPPSPPSRHRCDLCSFESDSADELAEHEVAAHGRLDSRKIPQEEPQRPALYPVPRRRRTVGDRIECLIFTSTLLLVAILLGYVVVWWLGL